MTLKTFKSVCWSILGVAAFYSSFYLWNFLLWDFLKNLYMDTPFEVFFVIFFFLIMFLCRFMGCLFFMPKSRLKAILYNGKYDPPLSEILPRVFSAPFIKRISLYTVLFIAEFILRFALITVFIVGFIWTFGFWNMIQNGSEILLFISLAVVGYAVLELPVFLLFYKKSYENHTPRLYEYKFGTKVFIYVTGISIIYLSLLPAFESVRTAIDTTLLCLFFFASSLGLWWIMYRMKWLCDCSCPMISKIKSFFGNCCLCKNSQKKDEVNASLVEEVTIESIEIIEVTKDGTEEN